MLRAFTRHLSTAEKLVNYGGTIDQLHRNIPNLLQEPLPNSILHPNVSLKLFPETHAIEAHGRSAYRLSCRLIQNGINLFVLPPDSKISILSAKVSKASQVEDRLFEVHWRTTNDREPGAQQSAPLSPGKILRSLNLATHEYPIFAGSFEFRMSDDCDRVMVHIIRDVEYLARPDVVFE